MLRSTLSHLLSSPPSRWRIERISTHPNADIWSWEASPRAGRARRLRSTPSSCFGIRRTLATEPASRMTTSRFGEPPLSARSPIDKFGPVALLGRSSRSLFHFARPSRATLGLVRSRSSWQLINGNARVLRRRLPTREVCPPPPASCGHGKPARPPQTRATHQTTTTPLHTPRAGLRVPLSALERLRSRLWSGSSLGCRGGAR